GFCMISATQLRPGMVVKFNNELYSIFSVNHRTPGNLRGFVQAKMRSLRTGSMTEHRFSSEDRVEKALLEEIEMEYLYDDGEYFYFMNTENFEQMHLMKDLLGDATEYLVSQLRVKVEFYEGKPISVELPATVDLTVVETEPGMRGATVSNVTKPAKMETGLVVQVPPFITEGEKIRVNTAEATYQERASRPCGAASQAAASRLIGTLRILCQTRSAPRVDPPPRRRTRFSSRRSSVRHRCLPPPADRRRAACPRRPPRWRIPWRSPTWQSPAREWRRRRSPIPLRRLPREAPARAPSAPAHAGESGPRFGAAWRAR